MTQKTHPLPCPFCGHEPSFEGNGSCWKDENRYVEMSLQCHNCDTVQSAQVGWARAQKMTPEEIEAVLRDTLIAKWNRREQPEVEEPLVGAKKPGVTREQAFEAWCEFTGHTSYKALTQKAFEAGAVFQEMASGVSQTKGPLSAAHVQALLELAGYANASPVERAHFINGVRHGELTHGIFPPSVEAGAEQSAQIRQEAGLVDTAEAPVGGVKPHAKQPRALLSARLRPGVECAPWVRAEVLKLEAVVRTALSAPAHREFSDDELRQFIPTVTLDKAAPTPMVWMQQKHAFQAIRAAIAALSAPASDAGLQGADWVDANVSGNPVLLQAMRNHAEAAEENASPQLTVEQVKAGFESDSHENFGDFLSGVRFAERTRGIGKASE